MNKLFLVLLLLASNANAQRSIGGSTLGPFPQTGGSGGGSNGIPTLNGFGTNTTLQNVTITSGTITGNGAGLSNITVMASSITNMPSPVINVKTDFGALGDGVNDSVAISNAVCRWTNTGGTLYFPPGVYTDTNIYTLSFLSPGLPSGKGYRVNQFMVAGSSPGMSVWNGQVTNATFITITNGLFDAMNISIDANNGGTGGNNKGTAGTNSGIYNYGNGNAIHWNNVWMSGWNWIALNPEGIDGNSLVNCGFSYNGIGVSFGGFDDSSIITSSKFSYHTIAAVVIGLTNQVLQNSSANMCSISASGNGNNIGVAVGGGSCGTYINWYSELATNGVVSIGIPPSLMNTTPGHLTLQSPGPVILSGCGTLSPNNIVNLYTNCSYLVLQNCGRDGSEVAVLSQNAQTDTQLVKYEGCITGPYFQFSSGTQSFLSQTYGRPSILIKGAGTNADYNYEAIPGFGSIIAIRTNLYVSGPQTNSSMLTVLGTGKLVADGSALTGLNSSALTGALPAVSGVNLTALPNNVGLTNFVGGQNWFNAQLFNGLATFNNGATLAGSGLFTLNGPFNHSLSVRTTSGTFASTFFSEGASFNGSSLTANEGTTATSGRQNLIMNLNASPLTIASTPTIDGMTLSGATIGKGQYWTVQGDGTAYHTVGAGSVANLNVGTVNTSGTVTFNVNGMTETQANTGVSVISALTITLPTISSIGQHLRYFSADVVTTITVTGGTTVYGTGLTTLPANGTACWEALDAGGTWMRIQ